MSQAPDATLALTTILEENVGTIGFFYRLATALLVGALLTHMAFASYYVYAAIAPDTGHVLLFAVFNIAALIVEVYLGRIAFMLGSRAGQLRDIQYALRIVDSGVDAAKFECTVRAIMASRRDVAGLKLVDIENLLAKVTRAKRGGKDAA
jgi:hypothetical protein